MDKFKPLKLGRNEKNNLFKIRRIKKITRKLFPLLILTGVLFLLAVFLLTRSGTTTYVTKMLSSIPLRSTDERANVLLLGIAGGKHDGGSLTDTIIVASINLKTNQVHIFSIPRDLWLPSLKSKANAVYQIGLSQNNGLGLAKTVMGNILGLPIHYALRVDFQGFVKAIDAIDGIESQIDNPFDDYLYPIQGAENDLCGNTEKEIDFSEEEAKELNIEPGKRTVLMTPEGKIATDSAEEGRGLKYFDCRYERIRFDAGKTKMSGAVALSFVRSRHGTNGEGSDFARAKRQQKIIEAIRNRVLSLETLANPQKIADLIEVLGKSIDTDISIKDAVEFYKISKKTGKISNFVLDNSPLPGLPNNRISLLVHPSAGKYGGAYVLISEDDDFAIIQGYVKKILGEELTDDEQNSFSKKE